MTHLLGLMNWGGRAVSWVQSWEAEGKKRKNLVA